MNNIFIAFILAIALTTIIAITTMFLVDIFFGQPLLKQLRKKYNELFISDK